MPFAFLIKQFLSSDVQVAEFSLRNLNIKSFVTVLCYTFSIKNILSQTASAVIATPFVISFLRKIQALHEV